MSMYLVLKYIHVLTALLSILGFIIRGVWMMQSSEQLQKKWVKIVPHVNDTILLGTAIVLAVMTAQYPGPAGWVNAKIIGLIVYIVLGVIALKRGKTKQVRIIAWLLALVTFAYIVMVALSKQVLVGL